MLIGPVIALSCAVTWSLAVILLKKAGTSVHPTALNAIKNTLGLFCLALSAWWIDDGIKIPADSDTLLWLLGSGLVGIGVADGLVLRSMQLLEATQLAIVESLFAPFVMLLAMLMLGETPTLGMLLGGALVLGSLLFVIPWHASGGRSQADTWRGMALMSSGLFLTAFGIVAIKPHFGSVPLFSLVTIRMAAGAAGSWVVLLRQPQWREMLGGLKTTRDPFTLLAACLMSSYVSITLWVAGYSYLQAAVAALLNQTSTIFTVLFAVLFLGEKMHRRIWLAVGLAFVGVALLTTQG